MSAETQTAEWGVDSEHGRLLDVLLCPPDNFHWLETSAITRATLASGRRFEPENSSWQTLLDRLPDTKIDADRLPHPTRFVEMTGIDRGRVGVFTRWIRPRQPVAA